MHKESQFQSELSSLLNRHCQENGSNTPDFILAEYLVDCLKTFNKAMAHRARLRGEKNLLDEITELS